MSAEDQSPVPYSSVALVIQQSPGLLAIGIADCGVPWHTSTVWSELIVWTNHARKPRSRAGTISARSRTPRLAVAVVARSSCCLPGGSFSAAYRQPWPECHVWRRGRWQHAGRNGWPPRRGGADWITHSGRLIFAGVFAFFDFFLRMCSVPCCHTAWTSAMWIRDQCIPERSHKTRIVMQCSYNVGIAARGWRDRMQMCILGIFVRRHPRRRKGDASARA